MMKDDQKADFTEQTCLYCHRLGPAVCDSPDCQKFHDNLTKEMDSIHKSKIRSATRAAIIQRCKCEQDWMIGRMKRWFYTLKCLICILFGWSRNHKKVPGIQPKIEVAQYHFAELYAGWESESVSVGQGLFFRWWFELESDGDWYM